MKSLLVFYKNLLLKKSKSIKTIVKWFAFSAVFGAVFFYYDQTLLEDILAFFDEKFGPEPSLNFDLVLKIFLQNLSVSAMAVFGGVVLGIAPFFIGTVNGFVLGYILHSLVAYSDMNWQQNLAFITLGLVPHAILELPTFIIAAGTGLSLGIRWIKKESQGQRLRVLGEEIRDGLIMIPAIGFVLFIAALIEVYVSGNLIK